MYENVPTSSPRRSRRGLLWVLFGLAGILMSTAWATGFGTSDSGAAGTGPAQNAFGLGAVNPQSPSAYASAITNPGNLAITFDGLWGQIAADTTVFQVDLTGFTGTFYSVIYVNNLPFQYPWSAAQLKWHQFDSACGDLDATDWDAVDTQAADDASGAPKLMNITTADAHVSFAELDGGSTYCFGIASTDLTSDDPNDGERLHADDINGTFLTRPDTAQVPTAPDFTAIVNRSAD